MKTIYLDHAATTPMHEEVIEAMVPVYKEIFGNPSSVHSYGRKARHILDQARAVMAKSIHATEKEITFTSGGTEADNLALRGIAEANKDKGNHIIVSTLEHHAVLNTAEALEEEGWDVTYLPVTKNGKVSMEDVKNALTDNTVLVSIMYVNNETGIIQPISEIGALLKEHQAYFHTDAVQAYGLLDINVEEQGIDLLTVTAHKINGPKGIGFLYAQKDVALHQQQFGGEQERKRRAGTESVPLIAGFQKAVEIAVDQKEINVNTYKAYKKQFIETLTDEDVDFAVNGNTAEMVPTIVNISFPGMNVETLLANFDLEGIAASSGSACTAGSIEPSHVLSAMFGSEHPCTTNSVRFSFGMANTEENVTDAARKIAAIIKRLRK